MYMPQYATSAAFRPLIESVLAKVIVRVFAGRPKNFPLSKILGKFIWIKSFIDKCLPE